MSGLSLKRFILRSEVLKLYREMLRTVRQIPDEHYRQEMKTWVRTDFRKFKHETNELEIEMLLNKGKHNLKKLSTAMQLAR